MSKKKKPLKKLNLECIFCLQPTTTGQHLENHLRSHTKETPHFCKLCPLEYREARSLIVHDSLHKGVKPFKCPLCDSKFRQRSNVDVHVKLIHSDARPFQCEQCPKKFKLKQNLKVHLRSHSGQRPYKCQQCDKRFMHPKGLKDHLHQYHNIEELPFKCDICGNCFAFEGRLKQHLKNHGEKEHKCEFCGDTFSILGNLKQHLKTHKSDIVYKDANSGAVFEVGWRGLDNTKQNMDKYPLTDFKLVDDDASLSKILFTPRHPEPEFRGQEYVHGVKNEDDLKFKCDFPDCVAVFTNRISLIRHATHMHRGKVEDCVWCGMTFLEESVRVSHLSDFHPDLEEDPTANPLQCKKCGKVKRDKLAFKRHVRDTHGGQRSTCLECGAVLKNAGILQMHMRYKHEREKEGTTHPCTICTKVYKHRGDLRKHIWQAHRGKSDKVYRCVICATSYTDKQVYWLHMRQHTNPKFHFCRVCNMKFRYGSHYTSHLNSEKHRILAGDETKLETKEIKIEDMDQAETKPEAATLEIKSEEEPIEESHENPSKTDATKNDEKAEGTATVSLTTEELIEACLTKSVQVSLHRVDEWKAKRWTSAKKRAKNKDLVEEVMDEGEQYLKCTYCDKDNFPDLVSVKNHEKYCLRMRQSKKIHACTICHKEFDMPCALTNHMRAHSDNKGFQCSYCDTSFKLNYTRMRHEKVVHFGIRYKEPEPNNIKCNYEGCDKVFKFNKGLKRHIETVHLKVQHPCDKCDKIFKRGDALRAHIREDHSGNPTLLLCRPCKRAFRSRRTLLEHFRTKRHQRKAKAEGDQQIETKEEMIEIISGYSLQPGADSNEDNGECITEC